jgi:hypothetical protein
MIAGSFKKLRRGESFLIIYQFRRDSKKKVTFQLPCKLLLTP